MFCYYLSFPFFKLSSELFSSSSFLNNITAGKELHPEVCIFYGKRYLMFFSLKILCIYIINLFIEMWIDSYIFFILQSYIWKVFFYPDIPEILILFVILGTVSGKWKFNLRTNDVRHFPKGIFPNGNFPNVKFLKSVLTAAAALGPLAYFRRFRKPNITFGKFGNRAIVTWEVGLGEMPLGKYLARVAILLNRCESDSLLNKWRVTWKLPLVPLGGK